METNSSFYGTEKINKIFFKIAPPVMLAQLIQALYNIVDSLFVGKYSESGLTALSIIYPVQLLMIALAVGTGVGINTNIAHFLGIKRYKKADEVAGIGFSLAIIMWILFAVSCYLLMPAYARLQTTSDTVIADVITYGCVRGQHWIVYREHMDKGTSGKRRYEDTDDRTDHRSYHEYCVRSDFDLWAFWYTKAWNSRSCICNDHRTGCSGTSCYEEGISPFAVSLQISRGYPQDLCAWNSEYHHAGNVYILHIWIKYDPCRIFR